MKVGGLHMKFAMLIIAAATVACTAESDPPLAASEVRLLAPLPGSHAAVGYLSLHNRSGAALTIDNISSSNFGEVQMHETLIRDGVARMQALGSVTIEPGASVKFVAGGKHLMLLQPTADLAAGSDIMLEIHYDSGGMLVISTTMQSRLPAQ